MQLIEGSQIIVNCSGCGGSQFTVTVIAGVQRITCPECRKKTIVEFRQRQDGSFIMTTR